MAARRAAKAALLLPPLLLLLLLLLLPPPPLLLLPPTLRACKEQPFLPHRFKSKMSSHSQETVWTSCRSLVASCNAV